MIWITPAVIFSRQTIPEIMRSGTQTSVFKNVLVIRELKASFDHNFI